MRHLAVAEVKTNRWLKENSYLLDMIGGSCFLGIVISRADKSVAVKPGVGIIKDGSV